MGETAASAVRPTARPFPYFSSGPDDGILIGRSQPLNFGQHDPRHGGRGNSCKTLARFLGLPYGERLRDSTTFILCTSGRSIGPRNGVRRAAADWVLAAADWVLVEVLPRIGAKLLAELGCSAAVA